LAGIKREKGGCCEARSVAGDIGGRAVGGGLRGKRVRFSVEFPELGDKPFDNNRCELRTRHVVRIIDGLDDVAGLTYSGSASFKSNNFSYTISFSAALGEISTNTAEQQPPAANVLAPLSGSTTLANNTSGYTSSGKLPPRCRSLCRLPDEQPNLRAQAL
jgi:hypothetical protein